MEKKSNHTYAAGFHYLVVVEEAHFLQIFLQQIYYEFDF